MEGFWVIHHIGHGSEINPNGCLFVRNQSQCGMSFALVVFPEPIRMANLPQVILTTNAQSTLMVCLIDRPEEQGGQYASTNMTNKASIRLLASFL